MDHADRFRYHYWDIITIISHQLQHFLPFLPSILNGHDRRQFSIILSSFWLSSLYMFILFSHDKNCTRLDHMSCLWFHIHYISSVFLSSQFLRCSGLGIPPWGILYKGIAWASAFRFTTVFGHHCKMFWFAVGRVIATKIRSSDKIVPMSSAFAVTKLYLDHQLK